MSEIDRVKGAVQAYVDGVVEFDFSKGEGAWHPDGFKISYYPDSQKLKQYTISETKPNLTQEEIKVMKEKVFQTGTIISAERTGDAASVKLVWNYEREGLKKEITDYILLLRIDGEWKIVAKVFNE